VTKPPIGGGSASFSSSSMISGSWGAPGFDLDGFEGTDDLEDDFRFDEEDCDLLAAVFFLVLGAPSSSSFCIISGDNT
jgi:hypothetical protein